MNESSPHPNPGLRPGQALPPQGEGTHGHLNKSALRILGVDPGTHRMGFGVLDVESDGVCGVAWGCLEASRSQPIHQRLHHLHQALAEVVRHWSPTHLAIEEPFVATERGAKSGVAVGQAQAVALLLAASHGMEVHRYSPSSVKSAVADYGASSKAQVQRALQAVLRLDRLPGPEDASDALAVALCHANHWRMTSRLRMEIR